MFDVGRVYKRRADLHARYGGQQQGGIATPTGSALVFLFTNDTGDAFGYQDEFRPDGTFWYTGEGQVGDMQMVRGNRAVQQHLSTGKELHLFEATAREGDVRYLGRATYLAHHYEDRPDRNGDLRKAIIFELTLETEPPSSMSPASSASSASGLGTSSAAPAIPPLSASPSAPSALQRGLWAQPLSQLRQTALLPPPLRATPKERRTNAYVRSEAVRVYVRRRAGGSCEGCGSAAPFVNRKNRPYLEPHHVRRVSDGGPDHPRFVIALCPNCHRLVHHGKDGDAYNAQLIQKLATLETGE